MYKDEWTDVALAQFSAMAHNPQVWRLFVGDRRVVGVVPGGGAGPQLIVSDSPDYVPLFEHRPSDVDVFQRDADLSPGKS